MADTVTVKPMATYDGAPLRMTAMLTELEADAPQFAAAPADAPDPYLQQRARRPKMNTYRRCARSPTSASTLHAVLCFEFLRNVEPCVASREVGVDEGWARYMLLRMVKRLRPEELQKVEKVRAAAARAQRKVNAILRDHPPPHPSDVELIETEGEAEERREDTSGVEAWEATLPADAPRNSTVEGWLDDELGRVRDAVPRRVSQHQRELLTESRRRELTLRQLWEVIGRASACERACFPSPHLPLAATRVVVGPSLHTGL